METIISSLDTHTLIAIKGRLDTLTAPEFDKATEALRTAETPGDIVIDCAEMEYISSAGLRSFITLLKKTKASQSSLEVINLSDSIRAIFDMTGFTTIFNIK